MLIGFILMFKFKLASVLLKIGVNEVRTVEVERK